MGKKIKYYRVRESGCSLTIMTGHELSSLQRLGVNIKKLRNATKEEYEK